MLHVTKNVKKKYRTLDPYIQRTVKDIDIINYRDYYEAPRDELDNPYKINKYRQFGVDKLRDKRQDTYPSTDTTGPPAPPSPPGPPGPHGPPLDDEPIVYEKFLTPLYVITAFFAALLIFGPLLVRKGPNRGIVQASIMLSAFCMWIFWFTIYFGQMNPLMGPRLENTTVAWIAYKLGNPFKNTTL